jgi:hypothetical protein
MANVTITSGGTYSTYTLSAPLTNGQNIDFSNNGGTANGVLILTDNGQCVQPHHLVHLRHHHRLWREYRR